MDRGHLIAKGRSAMRPGPLLAFFCGVVFLALMGPLPLAEAQKKKPKAKEETGPIRAEGRFEAFVQGQDARYAIWHESLIWHLHVTSKKNQKAKFQGKVWVTKGILQVRYAGLEKAKKFDSADWVFPHTNRRGFDFQIWTSGAVDNLTFQASAEADDIHFDLLTNGDNDAKRI